MSPHSLPERTMKISCMPFVVLLSSLSWAETHKAKLKLDDWSLMGTFYINQILTGDSKMSKNLAIFFVNLSNKSIFVFKFRIKF